MFGVNFLFDTHTQKHRRIYIYIYIYMIRRTIYQIKNFCFSDANCNEWLAGMSLSNRRRVISVVPMTSFVIETHVITWLHPMISLFIRSILLNFLPLKISESSNLKSQTTGELKCFILLRIISISIETSRTSSLTRFIFLTVYQPLMGYLTLKCYSFVNSRFYL